MLRIGAEILHGPTTGLKGYIMSNASTGTVKSVNVITDAQEEELINYMRSLHGKMLTILQGVGIKPTFNDKFPACTNEDYKNLHQQGRILLSAKKDAKWDTYIGPITDKVNGVIATHMNIQHEDKEEWESSKAYKEGRRGPFPTTFKVPMSELLGCWPQGTDESRIVAELDKLFPKNVGKSATGTWQLTVTYKPVVVAEAAPKSENKAKAA